MEFTEGVRFDSLHLSPEIIRAIEKRNIEPMGKTPERRRPA